MRGNYGEKPIAEVGSGIAINPHLQAKAGQLSLLAVAQPPQTAASMQEVQPEVEPSAQPQA